jgi:putative FmdB family regulatory protein
MITYTVERLYHFRCCVCGQWFTVGDCPVEVLAAPVTCPACRHTATAKVMT